MPSSEGHLVKCTALEALTKRFVKGDCEFRREGSEVAEAFILGRHFKKRDAKSSIPF